MNIYLIIKEIIPFENKQHEITHVYERCHLVLSKQGTFQFPKRVHGPQWNQLSFKSSNEMQNAIHFYGFASYFIFNKVTWTRSKIVLEWQRFNILKKGTEEEEEEEKSSSGTVERQQEVMVTVHNSTLTTPGVNHHYHHQHTDTTSANKGGIDIQVNDMSHTWMIENFEKSGVAYISLGKRFCEKCTFISSNTNKGTQTVKRVIGTTIEVALTTIPPQMQ